MLNTLFIREERSVAEPRSRKKRSTMFSQEALVGVKWTWNE